MKYTLRIGTVDDLSKKCQLKSTASGKQLPSGINTGKVWPHEGEMSLHLSCKVVNFICIAEKKLKLNGMECVHKS